MIVQVGKKHFNLSCYERLFRRDSVALIFLFSRLGRLHGLPVVPAGTFFKSLNISLIRKLIINGAFSGSSYAFCLVSGCGDLNKSILDSLTAFRQFCFARKDSVLLQSVVAGPYILGYALFSDFQRVLASFLLAYRCLAGVKSGVLSGFLSLAFFPFLLRPALLFLKVLFSIQLNFFNLLAFIKKTVPCNKIL